MAEIRHFSSHLRQDRIDYLSPITGVFSLSELLTHNFDPGLDGRVSLDAFNKRGHLPGGSVLNVASYPETVIHHPHGINRLLPRQRKDNHRDAKEDALFDAT